MLAVCLPIPAVQLKLIVYVPAGVAVVVVIATAWVAPGATAGVMLKVSGDAARPVATGTVTVQATEVVEPEVSVATTFGVVLEPATTVALVGLQATVYRKTVVKGKRKHLGGGRILKKKNT